MRTESHGPRARFYNRVAKTSIIVVAVGFGSLIVLLALPVRREVGLIVSALSILLMLGATLVMIAAIVARDVPAWRKNRWRFSISSLLGLMLAVAMALGGITAAERDVSAGRMVLGFGGFAIAYFIATVIYIHRARVRYFRAMDADGRYLDWNAVAAASGRGEGTLLVGKVHQVITVWWSARGISTLDEARAAIESDAFVTVCPQRKNLSHRLREDFPDLPVIEVDARQSHFWSAIS